MNFNLTNHDGESRWDLHCGILVNPTVVSTCQANEILRFGINLLLIILLAFTKNN
jgi:hypothetical protein